jgi:2-keto-4-pentenoate hydratase/2-oxohepta-3-ene-1,7-dioic acid hydratase in catechol pathway
MRLVTYQSDGAWRPGVLLGETIVDTERAAQFAGLANDRGDSLRTSFASNRQVIERAPRELQQLASAAQTLALEGQGIALSKTRLDPPIPDPEKLILIGLNYRDHAQESNQPLPEVPMLIPVYRNALAGPHDAIVLPKGHRDYVDYEGELAIVIGRQCKHVQEEDALDFVAGAMVINDVSARDMQKQSPQWAAAKMIDTFKPCGPALVLRDEISDLGNLTVMTRVNGQEVQHSSTTQFIFSVPALVAYLSSLVTLEAGDIIATGTPPGVGFARKPPLFLRNGDVVEVEIPGIGILANLITEE